MNLLSKIILLLTFPLRFLANRVSCLVESVAAHEKSLTNSLSVNVRIWSSNQSITLNLTANQDHPSIHLFHGDCPVSLQDESNGQPIVADDVVRIDRPIS